MSSGHTVSRNQGVLDASVALLECRLGLLRKLEAGKAVDGARLVGAGQDLSSWTMEQSRGWSHLLSTRFITTTDGLRSSLPNNRLIRSRGLQMVSVFDDNGTDAGARRLLELEPDPAYFFGEAPVHMRIIDQREVLLAGSSAPLTLLLTRSPAMLSAAMAYWHAVMATARPSRRPAGADGALSARQLCIVELLRQGLTDHQVARVLAVSPRTVSSEVSTIMAVRGVSSRFALGFAVAHEVVGDVVEDDAR